MPGEIFRDKGIIKKIYLKDFVTYNEVVLTPGRNLNMIIGPNGTGKSTLVSAIALGLGATPKTLGKPGHIEQYIRRGCPKATIVIDIQQTPERSLQITRAFTRDNKSAWVVNGQLVAEKKVLEMIHDMNIQVNNLCQFLPQERVKSFSEMDPRELLINTEKSVGDPQLHNYHLQLIEFRSGEERMVAEIDQKKSKLDVDNQNFARLEESVSSIRERTAVSNRLTKLKQKKAWMQYDDAKKVGMETKNKRDEKFQELKKLQDSLAPTDNIIKKKKLEAKNLENLVNSHNRKVNEHELKLNNIIEKLDNCHYDVKNFQKENTLEIEQEKSRDQEIKKAQIRKNKLENDKQLMLEELGSPENVQRRYQESEQQLGSQKKVTDELFDELTRVRNDCDKVKYEISNIQRLMNGLKNVESKRLDVLRQNSKDTYEGVMWLRKNLDKFRGKIHEPMVLTLQLDDPSNAKFVERVIAQRDLIAFVCEDKDDMNLLLNYLRKEQRLVINAVHSDPDKVHDTTPNYSLEQLRQFGFQNYLIEFIDAPQTVLNYLIQMYHIHNIPVGTAAVEDNGERIPDSIHTYFSPNNSYSVRKSKYTGDKSTSIVPLTAARFFNINIDSGRIQALEQKILGYEHQLNSYKEEMQTVNEQLSAEKVKLEEIRTKRANCRAELNQIQKLDSEINVARSKLARLENDRKSIESIKANTKQKILRVVKKQTDYYNECNQLYEKIVLISSQCRTDSFKFKNMQQEVFKLEEESQTLRENLKTVSEEFDQLDTRLKSMMKDINEYHSKALKSTNGIGPEHPNFKKLQNAFGKLPKSQEEIDEAIGKAKGQLYCLSNQENGEQILQEYDKLKQDIERMKNEIKGLEDRLIESRENISNVHDQWIPLIHGLVQKIGTNFSEYFESVGCVGEIKLNAPDNPKDYDQYEMQIAVKFRDNDELQIFDKERQSGGERAFTTAIYMLSLQELCNVPFRCVDEINQGMDPVYERRVMDLLVELTTNRKSSQYFLITPKLLPNLHYNDNCRIHVVHNGPWVLPSDKFSMQNYSARISA